RPPDRDVQFDRVTNTAFLLRKLDDESKRIMLPTLVVAEYLQGTPVAYQLSEFAVLAQQFAVLSYDAACARMTGQVWNRENWGIIEDGNRQWLKVDVGIVATAIIHGAECIYTGDRAAFERIAGGRIQIRDIPLPDLFPG